MAWGIKAVPWCALRALESPGTDPGPGHPVWSWDPLSAPPPAPREFPGLCPGCALLPGHPSSRSAWLSPPHPSALSLGATSSRKPPQPAGQARPPARLITPVTIRPSFCCFCHPVTRARLRAPGWGPKLPCSLSRHEAWGCGGLEGGSEAAKVQQGSWFLGTGLGPDGCPGEDPEREDSSQPLGPACQQVRVQVPPPPHPESWLYDPGQDWTGSSPGPRNCSVALSLQVSSH